MTLSDIVFKINAGTLSDVLHHIENCRDAFIPPLNNSVDINKYAEKIVDLAVRFEAWHRNTLIGLVAAYFNDEISKRGFITNVSVENEYNGRGIAKTLLQNCLEFGRDNKFRKIYLKVNKSHLKAVTLYKRLGFESERSTQCELIMFRATEGR